MGAGAAPLAAFLQDPERGKYRNVGLVMSGGKLQEQGRFEELDRKDSLTALLMAAE